MGDAFSCLLLPFRSQTSLRAFVIIFSLASCSTPQPAPQQPAPGLPAPEHPTGTQAAASKPALGSVRPPWVDNPDSGPSAPLYDAHVYATGMSDERDGMLRQQSAESVGRAALGERLRTRVYSLVETYMASTQDFMDPSRRTSAQAAQAITRTVADECVMQARRVESWMESGTTTLYVLMAVPQEAWIAAYKRTMARDVLPAFPQERRVEATTRLEDQVRQLKGE